MRRLGLLPAIRLVAGAVLAVALLPGSCRRAGEAAPPAAGSSRAWYTLHEGRLEVMASAPTGAAAANTADSSRFLPWTVQARVSDLAVMGGKLHVAVNGYGVAWAELPLTARTRFSMLYDPTTFSGRTLTEILPGGERAYLHLYVDRTLVEDPIPAGAGVSFVAYRAAGGEAAASFLPLAVPFQTAHPDWEAVAMVRTSPEEIAVEWKHTSDERTEFAYTRLRPREGKESTIDRATFRAAYGFLAPSEAGTDPAVQALFAAVRLHLERTAEPGRSTAVHLVVRAEGRAPERYRYQPPGYAEQEDIDLATVPARREDDALWALSADGTLFRVPAGGSEVTTVELPRLPDSYRYTAFALAPRSQSSESSASGGTDAFIAASWEEVRFTTVGEAGLYLGSLRAPGR